MTQATRTRFGVGLSARGLDDHDSLYTIIPPTLGLDVGRIASHLQPGYTPAARNFVLAGNNITPRSGLSHMGTLASFTSVGLGGREVYDVTGNLHGLALSAATSGKSYAWVYNGNAGTESWSSLSYCAATSVTDVSSRSNDYWDIATIYDASRDQNIAVFSNGTSFPKFWVVNPGTATTFSDYTWPFSVISKAKYVLSDDNRIVMANCLSTVSNYPQRVVWSVRGNPLDFTIANGASFEDLLQMRGVITKLVSSQDGFLVCGDQQVYRATRRGDAYGYDFRLIEGCPGMPYPRTIVATPYGIMWLAQDNEIYILAGNQFLPLGPNNAGDPSRIRRLIRGENTDGNRAWSEYDSDNHAYCLFYPASDTTQGYPTRGLFYNFDNRSFFPQRFNHELSFGFAMQPQNSTKTIRTLVAFSSAGTPYRFLSTQTLDDTTAIDARIQYATNAGLDLLRFNQLSEVWLEYTNPSNSSVSVYLSSDLGNTFGNTPQPQSLSSTSHGVTPVAVQVSARCPLFEIRLNDGGLPRFGFIQAKLNTGGEYAAG